MLRAIEELGQSLRGVIGDLVEPALIAVLEREMMAPTGLGDDVAIPHASVEGLTRPVVALGLSADGIDFDSPDGRAARIVFLLLLPPKAYEREVRVLASLARSVFDDRARAELLKTTTADEAVKCLDENARRPSPLAADQLRRRIRPRRAGSDRRAARGADGYARGVRRCGEGREPCHRCPCTLAARASP